MSLDSFGAELRHVAGNERRRERVGIRLVDLQQRRDQIAHPSSLGNDGADEVEGVGVQPPLILDYFRRHRDRGQRVAEIVRRHPEELILFRIQSAQLAVRPSQLPECFLRRALRPFPTRLKENTERRQERDEGQHAGRSDGAVPGGGVGERRMEPHPFRSTKRGRQKHRDRDPKSRAPASQKQHRDERRASQPGNGVAPDAAFCEGHGSETEREDGRLIMPAKDERPCAVQQQGRDAQKDGAESDDAGAPWMADEKIEEGERSSEQQPHAGKTVHQLRPPQIIGTDAEFCWQRSMHPGADGGTEDACHGEESHESGVINGMVSWTLSSGNTHEDLLRITSTRDDFIRRISRRFRHFGGWHENARWRLSVFSGGSAAKNLRCVRKARSGNGSS